VRTSTRLMHSALVLATIYYSNNFWLNTKTGATAPHRGAAGNGRGIQRRHNCVNLSRLHVEGRRHDIDLGALQGTKTNKFCVGLARITQSFSTAQRCWHQLGNSARTGLTKPQSVTAPPKSLKSQPPNYDMRSTKCQ